MIIIENGFRARLKIILQMGLLSKGKPLSWEETKRNTWIVHRDGVLQFISLYRRMKDRKGDTLSLKWGDEV